MTPAETTNTPAPIKQHYLTMTLEEKIQRTKELILEWYLQYKGQVYVSFSGGKDSTVLLHIARSIKGLENIPAVYADTGLEYPEIRNFVKTFSNVTWLKPKMTFGQVIDKYGWPIISKEQSGYIYEARTTKSEKLRNIRTRGDSFSIAKRWLPLLDAPFKIGNKCCTIMKKNVMKSYEKETGRKPILGIMAEESTLRLKAYMKGNCNAFSAKRPVSKPMMFWTEQDVLQYIREREISICSVYGNIIEKDGKLATTGCDRTGCMFCMYGCHLDKEDRFERMSHTHPIVYQYVMEKLGGKAVYDRYMQCAGNHKAGRSVSKNGTP